MRSKRPPRCVGLATTTVTNDCPAILKRPRVEAEVAPEFIGELIARLESSRTALGEATYRVSQLVQANALLERHAHALVAELDHSRRLELHDPLTGLPNRTLFADRVEQALLRARRERGQIAVLLLDLVGFKAVNIRHGRAAGDAILCEVSRRIRASTSACNTACRLGGDEFVIVLTDIAAREDAQAFAEKIRSEIAKPLPFAERTFTMLTSVGVSIYPSAGSTCEALLEHARSELNEARRGRSRPNVHADAAGPPQAIPGIDPARPYTATAALMCGSAT